LGSDVGEKRWEEKRNLNLWRRENQNRKWKGSVGEGMNKKNYMYGRGKGKG
jgi:hypothetical protein